MNKENHDCKCNHDHEEHHDECCCHDNHDHDCGCNHHHDTITLTLENDTTLECNVLGVFEVEDKEYIALLPDEQENVLLYQYTSSDDEDVELTNIEDDDEFELVSKTFMTLIQEEESEEEE